MLLPRIIPCLLLKDGALVKTINFTDSKYIGDPINAVKIFNEKQADELILTDISASFNNIDPNYELIKKIAYESKMPICYGGGIKNIHQAKKIINFGVEKIAISSQFVMNSKFIKLLVKEFGSQSIVGVLDVKYNYKNDAYTAYINNGSIQVEKSLSDILLEWQNYGIGEILINSIDKDGTMKGYDLNLFNFVNKFVKVPLTFLGGAGSLSDFNDILSIKSIIGLAAGSMFVFKGKFRAVLISYPNEKDKQKLYDNDK